MQDQQPQYRNSSAEEAVKNEKNTSGDDLVSEGCGIRSWRPKCLQPLANQYVYTAMFVTMSTIQAMSYTYFNGIVNTVEKAFQISSHTMGYIVAGNDVSQIICGLIITHFASKRNKPFWMAVGMLIGASACFIYASTQILWSEESNAYHGGDGEQSNETRSTYQLCSADIPFHNSSSGNGHCNKNATNSSMAAALWLFAGQFISGIGGTVTYSLGFAYLDDNIKKKNSPIYMGLSASTRSFGPTLGYMLASFCLRFPIDLNNSSNNYDPRDPRWLGAWWMGFLIIGLFQTLFSLPLLLFPIDLRTQKTVPVPANVADNSKSSDFWPTIRRLLTNPILVANIFACGAILIPVIGVATFLPKYLEARFRQTASSASLFTGITGQLMGMVGTFTGAFIVWKYQPKAVYVAAWTAVVDIVYAIGFYLVMYVDCNHTVIEGLDMNTGRIIDSCSTSCNCQTTFNPVCVASRNFLSPCYAGCTEVVVSQTINKTINLFYNCSCGGDFGSDQTAYSGFCENTPDPCNNLWMYVTILGIVKLIVTSTRVGVILILVRSLLKQDKSVGLTLLMMAASIFGFIPGPIIYGAVVDSTCLVWDESPCGEKGNCWIYDVDAFSKLFHGMAIVFTLIAVFFDVVVVAYSKNLNLYHEDDHNLNELTDGIKLEEPKLPKTQNETKR